MYAYLKNTTKFRALSFGCHYGATSRCKCAGYGQFTISFYFLLTHESPPQFTPKTLFALACDIVALRMFDGKYMCVRSFFLHKQVLMGLPGLIFRAIANLIRLWSCFFVGGAAHLRATKPE